MQASFNESDRGDCCLREEYIVPPMDTYVRVVRHTLIQPTTGPKSTRRMRYHLNLDRVCINLSTDQYRDLLAIFENQKRRSIKRTKFHSIFCSNNQHYTPPEATLGSSSETHQRYITLYNTYNQTNIVEKELRHLNRTY